MFSANLPKTAGFRTGAAGHRSYRACGVALAVALFFGLCFASCGDDDGGPEEVPDVTGVYTASYSWSLDVEGQGVASGQCGGFLDVTGQTGSDFSGRFLVNLCSLGHPISEWSGLVGPLSGTIDQSGHVSISDLAGRFYVWCTRVGDPGYMTGTLSGDALTASGSVQLSCPINGNIYDADALLDLEAWRQ